MALTTALRVFGDNKIVPSNDVMTCGNLLLDQLVRKISEKSKVPIARVAKNGSVGKKTAICIKVDYDCMFFIDLDVLPMDRYNEFLEDVQDILMLNFSSEHITITKSSITYFYQGFYFDFLPLCSGGRKCRRTAVNVSDQPPIKHKSYGYLRWTLLR